MVTAAPPSCSRRTVASPRPEAPPTTSAPAFLMCMRRTLPSGSRQRDREQPVRIGEQLLERQPGGGEVSFEPLIGELGADLGAQLLARLERHVEPERADV